MADIFYYEDEKVWSDKYIPVMRCAGHNIDLYTNHNEAIRSIDTTREDERPDLLVLDMVEQKSGEFVGLKISEKAMHKWPSTPVIAMTCESPGGYAEIQGLHNGIYYFISKDKDIDGLVLLAIIKRLMDSVNTLDRYEVRCGYGALRVEQKSRSVYWNDNLLPLGPVEFAIVDLLASSAGAIVDYETLRRGAQIREICDRDIDWGSAEERDDIKSKKLRSTLATHAKMIRTKINKANGGENIAKEVLFTRSGFGYGWLKE